MRGLEKNLHEIRRKLAEISRLHADESHFSIKVHQEPHSGMLEISEIKEKY